MNPAELKGRSLITWDDYSVEEIRYLLDLSRKVKAERRSGLLPQRFQGRTLALLFEKKSTRTRCAFETAFGEEGGYPVFLSGSDLHLGAKESIEDTARVLGRMFDAIQFRGYKQATAETLAKYSGVPVYNGLTDEGHPTQVLADLMTLEEAAGELKGKTLCFVGDGRNNVARSLMSFCPRLGVNFSLVSPEALFPDEGLRARSAAYARETGATIGLSSDLDAGLPGADAVYTDVWVSMGEEAQEEERTRLLAPYQVNAALMAKTGKKDSIFLHCLPAIKGKEVSQDLIDGPLSWAWEQAENRKHTIKAIMLATIRD